MYCTCYEQARITAEQLATYHYTPYRPTDRESESERCRHTQRNLIVFNFQFKCTKWFIWFSTSSSILVFVKRISGTLSARHNLWLCCEAAQSMPIQRCLFNRFVGRRWWLLTKMLSFFPSDACSMHESYLFVLSWAADGAIFLRNICSHIRSRRHCNLNFLETAMDDISQLRQFEFSHNWRLRWSRIPRTRSYRRFVTSFSDLSAPWKPRCRCFKID